LILGAAFAPVAGRLLHFLSSSLSRMIFDGKFSEIGRSTEQMYTGLLQQLPKGTDPAHDYTAPSDAHKRVAAASRAKAERLQANAPGKSPHDDCLTKLQKALIDNIGRGVVPEDKSNQQKGVANRHSTLSPLARRQAQETDRCSPVFLSPGRDYVDKHAVENQFRAPPLGTYKPKEHVVISRTHNTEFGERVQTKSLKAFEFEQQVDALNRQGKPVDHLLKSFVSVDYLDNAPERVQHRMRGFEINRQLPRGDIVQNSNINYNVNSFTAGVMDGDKKCSGVTRQAVYKFSESPSGAKERPTYFIPGRFKLDGGPRTSKIISFDKQLARKPFCETKGRVVVNRDHMAGIPDRSLARDCHLLETPVPSFDIKRMLDRPDVVCGVEYHNSLDPIVDSQVMLRKLSYDVCTAERPILKKMPCVGSFSKALNRSQSMAALRSYGEDVCLQRQQAARKNPAVRSTELLPLEDTEPMRSQLGTCDYSRMVGRSPDFSQRELPPRRRDFHEASRFERGLKAGQTKCDVDALSPLSGRIGALRGARSYNAMPRSSSVPA